MKRVLIIFHRIDGDGLTSCMIARDHYLQNKYVVDLFGFNYGDKTPDIESLLRNYDEICLVDISLPYEAMIKLGSSGRTVWIDHHATAIQDSEKFNYSNLRGVRLIGQAACELTWNFFFPNQVMPRFVYLIGVYDTWRKIEVDWENIILPLQYASRTEVGTKLDNWYSKWEYLKDDRNIESFIEKGKSILKFLKQNWESWVKNCGFPVMVDGKYRAICMLTPMFGSSCFGSVLNDYDLYITANKKKDPSTGETYYSLSLYKEPDRITEFSCGGYLKNKFKDGGGHDSAAGCRISEEDFIHLITNCEI